jgi:hypothetical protein
MMRLGVEVRIGVSGLAVHFVTQTAIQSSVNIQVQEWEVAFTFGFHRELNGLIDAVLVVQEVFKFVRTMLPNDEGVVYVAKPAAGF